MKCHKDTQELMDRMRRIDEREDFVLDKKNAEESILKTYDLFKLKRPKKIVWCKDIFSENFVFAIRNISDNWTFHGSGSDERSESARRAYDAYVDSSIWDVIHAKNEIHTYDEYELNASSAGNIREILGGSCALNDWSSCSALDNDFGDFIFGFENYRNPDKEYKPNKNDKIYLEYCELLMKAKEYGLGYQIEWKNTLYFVPTPLIKIDEQNRLHSEHQSAIKWKGGKEFYYLHGINFSKDLYLKVISREMPMEEILKIKDIDQRTQAMKFAKNGLREFYKSQKGKMIDELDKLDIKQRKVHYELWKIPQGKIFNQTVYFTIYDCPSSIERGERREYAKGVPKFSKVEEAMAWGMSDDEHIITPADWLKLVPLREES